MRKERKRKQEPITHLLFRAFPLCCCCYLIVDQSGSFSQLQSRLTRTQSVHSTTQRNCPWPNRASLRLFCPLRQFQ